MKRGPLAGHATNSSAAPRLTVELCSEMMCECDLLELFDFGGLASGHLFNELLKRLGGGLTNLCELHWRRVVRCNVRQNPLFVATKSPVSCKVRFELGSH
jgi:hypothetical protein